MTKLRPCPFCGSTSLRRPMNVGNQKDGNLEIIYTHVECMDCGAEGPKIYYVKDVIKQWNDRDG